MVKNLRSVSQSQILESPRIWCVRGPLPSCVLPSPFSLQLLGLEKTSHLCSNDSLSFPKAQRQKRTEKAPGKLKLCVI